MCQRDLSGDDLVIVGYVGGRVLAAVLEFDSQPQPELLEVHGASPPIDAVPLPDRPRFLLRELPRGHFAISRGSRRLQQAGYRDECPRLRPNAKAIAQWSAG
jgi:hypothetical protein